MLAWRRNSVDRSWAMRKTVTIILLQGYSEQNYFGWQTTTQRDQCLIQPTQWTLFLWETELTQTFTNIVEGVWGFVILSPCMKASWKLSLKCQGASRKGMQKDSKGQSYRWFQENKETDEHEPTAMHTSIYRFNSDGWSLIEKGKWK